MTSQSPRIYLYKITFEEVLYYYYGVHKEKVFGEVYWGSPYTHKWCWELYTPKKQILQFFEFNDEGWLEAQEIEKRIIKPVFNTDKWCLNENVGGQISLNIRRKTGKKCAEMKLGFHSMSKEERIIISTENGMQNKILKRGICGLTKEQRIENGKKSGKKGGNKTKELGVGVCGLSKEERIEIGIKASQKCKKEKKGIWKLSPEERKIKFLRNCGNVNKEKWICLETGYITTAGPLTLYQKKRGIDTSKRKKL
jgi:hypothetical protein